MTTTAVTISSATPPQYTNAYLRRHLSVDDKTATAYRPDGKHAASSAPNAIWWPAFTTCHGASSGCAGRLVSGTSGVACYAYRLEAFRTNIKNAAQWRVDEFNKLDHRGRTALALAILRYSEQQQNKHGVTEPYFRLLASGDLYSAAIAKSWREAWTAYQINGGTMPSWLYTRAYGSGHDHAAAMLDDNGLPPANVTMYLSSDATMIQRTYNAVNGIYHRLPVAVMAATVGEGKRLLQKIRRNTDKRPMYACPADYGSKLYDGVTYRQGAKPIGACIHCLRCTYAVDTAPDIIFVQR